MTAAPVIWVPQGQLWVGQAGAGEVRTILGSCVSVVLWNRRLKAGALCHYLLASRQSPSSSAGTADAKYGSDALSVMAREVLRRFPASWSRYEARIYGGADMTGNGRQAEVIGARNVSLARDFVRELGAELVEEDVLGHWPRRVRIDTSTGVIECARGEALSTNRGAVPALES